MKNTLQLIINNTCKKILEVKGFTLIELLIVIIIIGVIAGIAYPGIIGLADDFSREVMVSNMRTLLTEIRALESIEKGYPGFDDSDYGADDFINEYKGKWSSLATIFDNLDESDNEVFKYQADTTDFLFSVKLDEDDYLYIRNAEFNQVDEEPVF